MPPRGSLLLASLLLAVPSAGCHDPRSACAALARVPASAVEYVALDPPTATAAASAPLADPPTTKRWKITFQSYMDVDHGDGRIASSKSREVTMTPDLVCAREESTPSGNGPAKVTAQVTPMPPHRRAVLASVVTHLLREHPHGGSKQPVLLGPYSLGSPPDEGGGGEGLGIEVEGEVWTIRFAYGASLAARPGWLAPLYGE